MMKKKMWVAIISTALLLTACSFAPQLTEKSVTLEYGENPYEEIQPESVIKDYDKIKDQYEFKMMLLDEDEKEIEQEDIKEDEPVAVGSYTMKIEYDEEQEPIQLVVEIKDTTAPEFVDFKDEIKIEQNARDVELKDYFKAKDLSEVTIAVKGEVDLTKTGTYEVTVIAADEYDNKAEKAAKVVVVSSKEAEKGELTETVDGKTPVSKETQEKIEQGSVSINHTGGNSGSTANNKPAGNHNSGSSGNTSSSGGSSSGSSGGASSSGNGQQACSIEKEEYGSAGKLFDTEAEAFAWAEAYIENDDLNGKGNITSYSVGPSFDTCGNVVGYSVLFRYEGQAPAWDF